MGWIRAPRGDGDEAPPGGSSGCALDACVMRGWLHALAPDRFELYERVGSSGAFFFYTRNAGGRVFGRGLARCWVFLAGAFCTAVVLETKESRDLGLGGLRESCGPVRSGFLDRMGDECTGGGCELAWAGCSGRGYLSLAGNVNEKI